MRTPLSADERLTRDVQRLCCAGLDSLTLREAAVARMAQTLPFDAYCCFTTDPMTRFFTHTVMGGAPQSDLDYFIEHVYFDDEINQFSRMAQTRQVVAVLSEGTGGALESSLCYREILRPRGHAHQLRSVFMVKQELWGGIELSREHRRGDFDARETALMSRLAAHLGAGLKAAALRGMLDSAHAENDTPGLLTLDRQGRIVNYNIAAERWLRELGWPASERDDATRTPQPIRTALAALRRALSSDTEATLAQIPRLSVQASSGRWLSILVDAALPGPDRSAETMVLIEPITPREAAWLRRSAYDLTAREQEVAELVVRGMATREIALALHITEYTVQDHLSHIFDKVGVRSRRQLAKRLFFDSFAASQQ